MRCMPAFVFSTELTDPSEAENNSIQPGEANQHLVTNNNENSPYGLTDLNNELPIISSETQPTEILIYCQNFNRMKSAFKINEIQ